LDFKSSLQAAFIVLGYNGFSYAELYLRQIYGEVQQAVMFFDLGFHLINGTYW